MIKKISSDYVKRVWTGWVYNGSLSKIFREITCSLFNIFHFPLTKLFIGQIEMKISILWLIGTQWGEHNWQQHDTISWLEVIWLDVGLGGIKSLYFDFSSWHISVFVNIEVKPHCRAATSTDFRNRLTGPPNSNRIQLTERFASPYESLCFHVFTGSDSPPGPPPRLSWQVVSLLVSNQTSFMQIKRRSKTTTCSVLMHKNKSLTWCHSLTVSSRIKQGKESYYSHRCNQRS